MQQRLSCSKVAPAGVEILQKLGRHLGHCGLGADRLELMKLRASQINSCAYCIDMHTEDAPGQGESEPRPPAVSARHEAPFCSERERASLAWTEAVTPAGKDHLPDQVCEQAPHFTQKELVDLTLAIIASNSRDRPAIRSGRPAGSCQPDHPIAKGIPG